ncbi:MAG TPA: hypothetical protein VGJ18_13620 [Gemmatimonadaceae bacterium]
MFFQQANDPFDEAIAERIRLVISRQPGHRVDEVAHSLNVPLDALRRLLQDSDQPIDTKSLIQVIVSLVRESGIDPKWLLNGHYDGAMHRRALQIGEDPSLRGVQTLHELVCDEYKRLRYGDTWSIPRAIAQSAHRFFVRQPGERER